MFITCQEGNSLVVKKILIRFFHNAHAITFLFIFRKRLSKEKSTDQVLPPYITVCLQSPKKNAFGSDSQFLRWSHDELNILELIKLPEQTLQQEWIASQCKYFWKKKHLGNDFTWTDLSIRRSAGETDKRELRPNGLCLGKWSRTDQTFWLYMAID